MKRVTFLQCVVVTLLCPAALPGQDWTLGPFRRPVDAPVIAPRPESVFTDPVTQLVVHWEALHTFNPAAAIAPDGSIAVIYRAEDDSGSMKIGGHTSRLGLAISRDGVHFTRRPSPVLFMDEDAQKVNEFPGGVEDPRLVRAPDGRYVLTYTQWARNRDRYSIGVATSRDLVHWTKWGPAFDDAERGRYQDFKYKSAAILTELKHGEVRAAKLHGKFWMYWGEIEIRLAMSDDLIHWTPVLDAATGDPKVLLSARSGHFDSGFPEAGPPPLLTARGIVLLYNAKNADKETTSVGGMKGDPDLIPGSYSVGEALFSSADPSKLLQRTDIPVFQPERAFERSGQYAAGTTFAEGLVSFRGQWLLYYGTADSFVGLATAPLRR